MAGDTVTIESEVLEVKRASSRWRQTMTRNGQTIATLEVMAASINTNGRPCRMPDEMAMALKSPELA